MSDLNYLLLFTTGLLGSLGHCLGMCGGIVAAYSLRLGVRTHLPSTLVTFDQVWPQLLPHAGRLTTYAVMGGVAGGLGAAVERTGRWAGVQGVVSIVAGVFMIATGLALAELISLTALTSLRQSSRQASLRASPWRTWLKRPGGTSSLFERWFRRAMDAPGAIGLLGMGLVWGLLPCGMVYAMLAQAATSGGVAAGLVTMLAFGSGTVPALLVLSSLSTVLGHRARGWLYRVAAALVIVFGVQAVLRGLAANGVLNHVMVGKVMLW